MQEKKTLKTLLQDKANKPKPKPGIMDTLQEYELRRLKPLAWLIENQRYTMEEITLTALAYHRSSEKRAQDIMDLIRSRQKENTHVKKQ